MERPSRADALAGVASHARSVGLSLCIALSALAACSSNEPGGGTPDQAGSSGAPQGGGGSPAGGTTPSGGEGNAMPTGGSSGSATGGISGGSAGDGGTTGGDAGSSSGGGAGAGMSNGGAAGSGGEAGTSGGAGSGGRGGGGGSAGAPSELAITPADGLWTGVRYYTGSTPSNRTSGPAQGPTQTYRVHNGASSMASVSVSVSGSDGARFEIVSPATFPASVAANGDLDVTLRLVTANSALGAAPAQDDGATVLRATLIASAGSAEARSRLYAVVLTYVELEPTFGQILDAFPEYTSNLPNSIRNDANPNPSTLPGVEAGTDEVRAPVFRRADTSMPVTMRPIGRFSPAGLVPFGSYPPGDVAARVTAGTLAQATDAHTNDKSRMLLPPLASGSASFVPATTTFGIFMTPAGVGVLASEDGEGFDGAHRVKIWTLRDTGGAVRPNEYLVGGEEAANGDYQDYVFIVQNVVPMP